MNRTLTKGDVLPTTYFCGSPFLTALTRLPSLLDFLFSDPPGKTQAVVIIILTPAQTKIHILTDTVYRFLPHKNLFHAPLKSVPCAGTVANARDGCKREGLLQTRGSICGSINFCELKTNNVTSKRGARRRASFSSDMFVLNLPNCP